MALKKCSPVLFLVLFASAFLLQGCHQSEDADLTFDEGDQNASPAPPVTSESEPAEDTSHLSRVKRFIWNIFGKDSTTTEKPSVASQPETTVTKSGRTTRQTDYNGEDDYDDGDDYDALEGSGEEPEKVTDEPVAPPRSTEPPTPGGSKFFRVTLSVMNRPYEPHLADPHSEQFRQLGTELSHELVRHVAQDLEGSGYRGERPTVNILTFSPTVAERRPALTVTLDIGVAPNADEQVLHRSLREVARGSLSSYQLSEEGFTFEALGEPHAHCERHQFSCDNGRRCLDNSLRCDGKPDCSDRLDELDCPARPLQCGPNEFACDEGRRCVDIARRCDRRQDCADNADERDCPGSRCGPEQFACDGGRRCVDNTQRCDNRQDCADGTDEQGCPGPRCSPGQFVCDEGRTCIDRSRVCDAHVDCVDRTDEQDCFKPGDTHPSVPLPQCQPGQFQCRTGQCLHGIQRCDHVRDCPGGEDEEGCLTCPQGHFRCDRGDCIPMSKRCDDHSDCPDGSGADERGCPKPLDGCVLEREFRCGNGACIPRALLCNTRRDCSDGSDERNCPCKAGQFQCKNGYCINIYRRCDGFYDCEDQSDEHDCPSRCRDTDFRCRNGTCIPAQKRCDSVLDCADGFDELGCFPSCRTDQFRCRSGSCLSITRRCDGISDCPGGEDELYCTTQCPSNEFRCASGQCIDVSRKCDGVRDCHDGEDEVNCVEPKQCHSNEFRCGDGTCIPIYLRCNGHTDCRDSSDERDCRKLCASTMFRCGDGDCIPSRHQCDGKFDCLDLSDEEGCGCKEHEFRCRSGLCIDARRRCDDRVDCDDFSDEAECGCKEHEFQCGNGKCIDARRKCDGLVDCRDRSDEINCECKEHQFRCGDGICIDRRKQCDGTADCRDYSDERNCDCKENEFRCGDGTCIDISRQCDGTADCTDKSDEHNCSVSEACTADEFRCTSGECIHHTLRCNRRRDCPDGSDEESCCTSEQFHCKSGECVAKHLVCDGQYHCRDGSDESECGICQPGQYVCANHQCIDRSQRCDGRYDCTDFSDEAGCEPDAGINIRVYPERQTIRQSQEVVFRCRDEGTRRLKVYWTRGDNSELPPGSTDARGRLTIPNIQPEHGGVYLCKAVGVPTGATGSQKAAYLTVQPYTPPTHKPPRPVEACKHDEATCQNGQCIPRKYVCDGDYDCEDGSDESTCVSHSHCEPNEMQCDSKKCILKVYHCDGDDDCGDGTDERGCGDMIPGSPCRAGEYQCLSGDQCIPKSFQCDAEFDCQDKSDEIGCSAPTIISPPSELVSAVEGETVNITCTAIGNPMPLINWRLNWGHIPAPPRVTTRSEGGVGIVTIRDAKQSDQGAWSCEAINSKQSVLATPDAILVVKPKGTCHAPLFNDRAQSISDCLRCFCFGVSQNCHSSSLHKTTLPLVTDVSVAALMPQSNGSYVDVTRDHPPNQNAIHFNPTNKEFRIDSRVKTSDGRVSYYWSLPSEFLRNQLNSYGGRLKYSFRYRGSSRPAPIADVVVSGNGLTLTHALKQSYSPERENAVQVPFFEGEWLKTPSMDAHGRHRGSNIATREDIMIVLQNVENIFIRASFDDDLMESSIYNVEMESASYTGREGEPANYVEQCSCPEGYTGNSCEDCAVGYTRRRGGQHLGECVPGVFPCTCHGHSNSCDQQTGQCRDCQHNTEGHNCEVCKRGFYGDATRGTPHDCQECPCPPLTMPSQLTPTCSLDASGEVRCDRCPIGYEGRYCDRCAPGYERYPHGADGVCRLKECEQGQFQCGDGSCIDGRKRCDGQYDCNDYLDEQNCGGRRCDPAGSLSSEPNPTTKLCQCKPLVVGESCDQCKASSFHLHPRAPFGCIECFCMGITKSCTSSTYHRQQEVLRFSTSTEGVRLTNLDQTLMIDRGLKLDPRSKELVYQDFSSHPRQTYYWSLPPRFLGDKGTSYGGFLNVTIRSDGSGTPSTDPDVIIRGNRMILMYRHSAPLKFRFPQHLSIPMFETSWVRADGYPSTRGHFLMDLADLSGIYIKATLADETETASLVEASLDIAVPYPTGQEIAYEVEHCRCPTGYKGLSCEDCDAGYTRSGSGLYLGLCMPCFCNGHSSDCDPETGICKNCRDNTHGDYCEECLPGYVGDAKVGSPSDCEPPHTHPCRCDNRGSIRQECDADDNCLCKPNVQGKNCNRCKDGYFNLEQTNPEGCSRCFCFGATDQCSSSSYYRNQTSMQLRDLRDPYSHNFQLSDRYHSTVVTEGIVVNPSNNEVSYSAFPHAPVERETLFWSLPEMFLGNKLTSYGGVLRYTQQYTADPDGQTYSDADIQITGNGVTIFHVKIPPLLPSETRTLEVIMREAYWQRVDSQGPTAATREDIMKALANVEVLLVRASFSSHMRSTSLRDVSLSSAVPSHYYQGQEVAVEVEQCTCPPGYIGLSCEECAPGYIRDTSGPGLGRCTRCRCNGHSGSCAADTGNCLHCRHNTVGDFCERCADGFYGDATRGTPEDCRPCPCPHTVPSNQFSSTCYMDTDNKATCNACQLGYTGRNCERCASGYTGNPLQLGGRCEQGSPGPSFSVQVEEREKRVPIGSTLTLRCTGHSELNVPFSLVWTKKDGSLAPRATEASGILIISDIRPEDAGIYVCTGMDTSDTSAQDMVVVHVDGQGHVPGELTPPSVVIKPRFQEVKAGHPVEFQCVAEGNPPPALTWEGGQRGILSPESTFINGVFRIPAARKSDEAEYFCVATNEAGVDRIKTVLFVRGEDHHVGESPHLTVQPTNYDARRGETVRFDCRATGHPVPNITWSFSGDRLPSNAQQAGGVLTVLQVEEHNQGNYICTARNRYGTAQGQATLQITTRRNIPSAHMEPERQTVKQGEDATIRCVATGTPTPVITFSKARGNLTQRHNVQGDTLIIERTVVEDRGHYVCRAENREGMAQATAILEVDRREPPAVGIYPPNMPPIQYGGNMLLQCSPTAGIPAPSVEWTRADGSPFTPSTELSTQGIIKFNRFTEQEEGTYVCTAKNPMGEATAVVTMKMQRSPRLRILQPNPYYVRVGDQIRLDCVSEEEPKSRLFWRRLQQHITTYSSIEDVHEGMTTLFIRRAAPSDAGTYVCDASGPEGTTAQERIQVLVQTGSGDVPGIVTEPEIVTARIGEPASLRCYVENTDRPVQYQWERADGATFSERTEDRGILLFRSVQREDAGEYVCNGIIDGNKVFSKSVTLAVVAPPTIELTPSRQSARPGYHVYIHCSAEGDQPITFHWSREGGGLPQSTVQRDGILEFRGISASDGGRYICTAVNAAGKATGIAEVLVEAGPSSANLRKEETAFIGSGVELKCPLTDIHPSTLEWTKDFHPLPKNARVVNGELWIRGVTRENAGRYICVSKVDGVLVKRDYIILHVKDVPSFEVKIQSSKPHIQMGDSLDLYCRVAGDAAASVQWVKLPDETNFPDNVQVRGSTLSINGVRPENGGVYRCSVASPVGVLNDDYVLAIEEIPTIPPNEVETRTAPYGSTVILDCVVKVKLDEPVAYTWSKQSGTLASKAVQHHNTLKIPDLKASDAGTYICTASSQHITIDVPTILVVTGLLPRFTQAPLSYMKLPVFANAYMSFDLEIRFKPEKDHGLLLYNGQQEDGGGDFISLGLTNGYVEFRFELGSGMGYLRSERPVEMDTWHTAKITREKKFATLKVDDQSEVTGSSQGKMMGLDLTQNLFVGSVPRFEKISRDNGFNVGFVGCVSNIKFGQTTVDFGRDAEMVGTTPCETCAVNPCLHDGVCQEMPNEGGYQCICPSGFSGQDCEIVGEACYPGVCGEGKCVNKPGGGFDCYCPLGRTGLRCEKNIAIVEPALADDAFLAYQTPSGSLTNLRLDIKFKPTKLDDCLLMYCAQYPDKKGDFTSIGIKNRSVEFRFDAGTGLATITHPEKLQADEWVTVSASRESQTGSLSLNGGRRVAGKSPGSARGVNLNIPMYIGGVDKEKVKVNPDAGTSRGFEGCIAHIEVNNRNVDLIGAVVDASNVGDCGGRAPCEKNPCQNHGLCKERGPRPDDFDCICKAGYSGRRCEIEEDFCSKINPCQNGAQCIGVGISYRCNCPKGFRGPNCESRTTFDESAKFNGDGWVALSRDLLPHSASNSSEVIKLSFSTTERDGLILFQGQPLGVDGRGQDYLSLAVVNGHLEFSYEMGGGPAEIISDQRVDDGALHTVELRRTGKNGTLRLDTHAEKHGASGGLLIMLNTKSDIYIGGAPDPRAMTAGRHTQGFKGCIFNVQIQTANVIDLYTQSIESANAEQCEEHLGSGDYPFFGAISNK